MCECVEVFIEISCKLLENMYDLCIKWIVLLYFNEISHFTLISLPIVIKRIALRSFN